MPGMKARPCDRITQDSVNARSDQGLGLHQNIAVVMTEVWNCYLIKGQSKAPEKASEVDLE